MNPLRFIQIVLFSLVFAASARAGSTTLVNDSTNGLTASFTRTANIDLDAFGASSVTVSVSAWARYDSAHTPSDDAVVNVSVNAGPAGLFQGGGSEITLPVSATFTKSGGQWFHAGTPVGGNVFARGSVELYNIGPETGVGSGSVTISVSWTDAPANRAPSISWVSAPDNVAHGQGYSVSAHGHDDDGNLTQVNVWKNGAGFAFGAGGNGTDADSGNSTGDGGPATVTFTAQAVDADGATSATISHTVTVGAPPPVNQPPTITWTITPGTVANGQSYSVSAHGYDPDGNLTQVNVWKNGAGFAFAGGGNGTDGDSGNSTADSGPATVTYTAQAVDSNGATSATISQTVTVSAPPPVNRAPTIAWNTTPGTVASGQVYSVSAHGYDPDGNLTQVNVWRDGAGFAFAGGGNGSDGDSGNSSAETGPTTITYTAQAVDADGAVSATISQVVTVNAPPPVNRAPTISWNTTPGSVASGQSYTISAHGYDPDGNLTQVNVWRNGAGFAFAGGGNGTDGDSGNSSAETGPTTTTYTAQAVDADGAASAIISQTVSATAPPPVNLAPSIAWTVTPGTVASGQTYTISVHAYDTDGNLAQVNVWKNGVPFAFGGGGNGADADSGNSTSDTGPATVTFTAQAVDTNGATSATISQTVTVGAPNGAPSISWNSQPGTAASGEAYVISAHGHDADGNLTQVNVWKNGVPFAFAGGGNGTDGDSGNSTADPGPANVTFTANAVDSSGATSATITQIVTIASPANVSATIGVSPSGTTAPGTATITWSSANASAVVASGPGLNSSAPNGTQSVSGLPVGVHTFTVTAQGNGGPVTRSATVIVAAPPTVSASISATVTSAIAPGTATVVWTSADATSVTVSGNGLSSGAMSGSQAVAGLAAGTHIYTLTAQGYGGPITRTATVVVNPPAPTVSGSISVNPTTTTEPGTATVSWNTADATAVAVSGPSVASGAANGSQTINGLPAGTYTFTLVAQGNGGPISRTAVLTVNPPPTFALTTSATAGGSVTAGGTYPAGSIVTISATPDATHRFIDWNGDAGGTANTIAVTMDRARFVQANFADKVAQILTFDPPGDKAATAPPFPLNASASSGLPVTFSLVSGPAALTGNSIALTGVGSVTVQASQAGDANYLPAAPISRTFNAAAPATLKYRGPARTLLRDASSSAPPPYVLEKP